MIACNTLTRRRAVLQKQNDAYCQSPILFERHTPGSRPGRQLVCFVSLIYIYILSFLSSVFSFFRLFVYLFFSVGGVGQVLNGQGWVLVDGAILDVSNFSQRHPGGARLILNAVGTDVTHELLGQELSVGHAMSFTPHVHPEVQ